MNQAPWKARFHPRPISADILSRGGTQLSPGTASLWQLSVVTTAEAEEAVTSLAGGVFGLPVCAYLDARTGRAVVALYAQRKSAFSARLRTELAVGLRQIQADGLRVGRRIRLRRLPRRDWAESWKRHFRPIAVGRKLLIKPSWSRQRAAKGQKVVVLDPGLSFGTGHHPTTRFALNELAKCRRTGSQSLLDIGTGSGILAIAAARLGYAPVHAFDVDLDAVRIAWTNARRNKVPTKLRVWQEDLTRLRLNGGKKYHLVCANLTADLLVAQRGRILARLRPDGRLVLAGILRAEFAGVARAYTQAGLKLVVYQTSGEWAAGAFQAKV